MFKLNNFLSYYPHFLAVMFLVLFFSIKVPARGRFFLRELLALIIAICLAHLDRWFHLWPAHLLFPSGHMTFCFGVSLSIGLLRPKTLFVTLPMLVPLGLGLIVMHYHTWLDVLGAIPLVFVVYGILRRAWPLPPVSPPLDMVADSP